MRNSLKTLVSLSAALLVSGCDRKNHQSNFRLGIGIYPTNSVLFVGANSYFGKEFRRTEVYNERREYLGEIMASGYIEKEIKTESDLALKVSGQIPFTGQDYNFVDVRTGDATEKKNVPSLRQEELLLAILKERIHSVKRDPVLGGKLSVPIKGKVEIRGVEYFVDPLSILTDGDTSKVENIWNNLLLLN